MINDNFQLLRAAGVESSNTDIVGALMCPFVNIRSNYLFQAGAIFIWSPCTTKLYPHQGKNERLHRP